MDPRIVESLLTTEATPARRRVAGLTAREREIVALIAAADTNAAIAERLGITTRAVERHVNAIFAKLGPSDPERTNRRVAAARVSRGRGLLVEARGADRSDGRRGRPARCERPQLVEPRPDGADVALRHLLPRAGQVTERLRHHRPRVIRQLRMRWSSG